MSGELGDGLDKLDYLPQRLEIAVILAQKKTEDRQFFCEIFKDEKVKAMPVSRNIIMNRLFVGVDVQTRRDCCFAISDDNGKLQESGWFGENHEEFLDLLKKRSAGSEIYIGIDAPRMPLQTPRQWYWVGNKRHWRKKTDKDKGRGRHCEIVVSVHRLANPQWTPLNNEAPDWMRQGFRLFETLDTLHFPTFEVFPSASYRLLSGEKNVKIEVDFSSCLPGPKDMLDAFVASVTVREFIHGNGTEVGNGDGLGSIVLPRPLSEPLIVEVLEWPSNDSG